MKRTIFVVGAGSGLGNGVARKFAQEGFKVVLMARREEKLAGFTDEFAQEGYEAAKKAVDVTDFSSFAARFAEAVKEHGTPDVLFYNVGITAPDDKEKLDAKTLVEHYIADVAGAYQAVKLVCTEDFGAKAGAILITGGGLALQPYIDYLPLSMDKAALRAMVQALAPSLNEKGIYIGTIQITGRIGSNDHFASQKQMKLFIEERIDQGEQAK